MKRRPKWSRRLQVSAVPEALENALKNDWNWADEADDPQIPAQRFVSMPIESLPDLHHDRDERVAADLDRQDDRRGKLLAALKDALLNVLSPRERFVLIQRVVMGDTYEQIAQDARPPISGRSQARKIEQRAIRKLSALLSKFSMT